VDGCGVALEATSGSAATSATAPASAAADPPAAVPAARGVGSGSRGSRGVSGGASGSASSGGAWLHADPCENRLDRCRMYEKGWRKDLSYIFAAARDHVVDVVPRYTEK